MRMNDRKVKIVLDADVIIHFIKGNALALLPTILPEYRFVILDIVLNQELRRNSKTRTQIDNHLQLLKNISEEPWEPDYQMMREYASLIKTLGIGESASMVYCKYNPNVLASSNLRDITAYCVQNDICYLSTMDFLSIAHRRGIMSEEACDEFIASVLAQGSKLPVTKLKEFKPRPDIFSL